MRGLIKKAENSSCIIFEVDTGAQKQRHLALVTLLKQLVIQLDFGHPHHVT